MRGCSIDQRRAQMHQMIEQLSVQIILCRTLVRTPDIAIALQLLHQQIHEFDSHVFQAH
jgi:hypothetical protein